MAISDQAVGFIIIGIGIVVVLGLVFGIASRGGSGERPRPPRGVHLPPPSYLPVVMSVGAALIGAGLAFRSDGQLANPFLAIPGLLVFVVGVIWWVRTAGREWREVEVGPHDDDTAAH